MQMGPHSHTVSKWQSQRELWLWLGCMATSELVTLSRGLGLCALLEAGDQQLQLKDQLSQKRKAVLSEKGRCHEDRQKQHISTQDYVCVCVCVCMHMYVYMYKISRSHSLHHSFIVSCQPTASSETWVPVFCLTCTDYVILNPSFLICKMRLLTCLLSHGIVLYEDALALH